MTESNKTTIDLPDLQEPEAPGFLDRWALKIILISLFLLPPVVYGAAKSLKVHSNDVNAWLPKGFKEAEKYEWFQKNLGVDEMIVASWPGCELDSEIVREFDQALEEEKIDGAPVFSRVVSGPEMLDEITSTGCSKKAAFNRIRGLVVGNDGKTTCVMAFPSRYFRNHRTQLVKTVRQIASDRFGIQDEDLKLGGPTVDGASIDYESKRSLDKFMPITVLVVFFLTWFRLRDLAMSMVVLAFSVGCAGVGLAILFYTGGQMNLTMVMLPTLTFILGVSACIHMANYYRKAVSSGNGTRSADVALRDGGHPVMISTLTTAVGMMSLGTSQVIPIRMFGLYSALGILAGLPIVLLLMPSAMHLLHGTVLSRFGKKKHVAKREQTSGVSRNTSWVVNWVCRSHWAVVIPSLVAMVVLSIGIVNLKASVKLQNRFAPSTRILLDYHWLEKNLGPLVPMEVVIRFGKENKLSPWQQMELVDSIESAIIQTTAVDATYSAATFRPPVSKGMGLRGQMQKKLVISKWEKQLEKLEQANLLKILPDENLWRISLRVAALNEIDYGGFLEAVDRNVQNQLAHINQPFTTAVLTGGIPLVYQAQHQILFDLAKSFCTAFVIITFILIFILGNIRAGMIAMIPNVFPPVLVFGAMGWMGVPIEIGSVMTASVALGIAVDDTIHFLTWYRRGTELGKSRYKSIQYAFDHCAKAMIDTTLICGLGVTPFLFSVFMPTVRFSRLLLILLATALAGDLILLPAILAGPAGLLFRLKSRFKKSADKQTVAKAPNFSKKTASVQEEFKA